MAERLPVHSPSTPSRIHTPSHTSGGENHFHGNKLQRYAPGTTYFTEIKSPQTLSIPKPSYNPDKVFKGALKDTVAIVPQVKKPRKGIDRYMPEGVKTVARIPPPSKSVIEPSTELMHPAQPNPDRAFHKNLDGTQVIANKFIPIEFKNFTPLADQAQKYQTVASRVPTVQLLELKQPISDELQKQKYIDLVKTQKQEAVSKVDEKKPISLTRKHRRKYYHLVQAHQKHEIPVQIVEQKKDETKRGNDRIKPAIMRYGEIKLVQKTDRTRILNNERTKYHKSETKSTPLIEKRIISRKFRRLVNRLPTEQRQAVRIALNETRTLVQSLRIAGYEPAHIARIATTALQVSLSKEKLSPQVVKTVTRYFQTQIAAHSQQENIAPVDQSEELQEVSPEVQMKEEPEENCVVAVHHPTTELRIALLGKIFESISHSKTSLAEIAARFIEQDEFKVTRRVHSPLVYQISELKYDGQLLEVLRMMSRDKMMRPVYMIRDTASSMMRSIRAGILKAKKGTEERITDYEVRKILDEDQSLPNSGTVYSYSGA